jgi:hypothetical protein
MLDSATITRLVEDQILKSVDEQVFGIVTNLAQDPVWVEKIERIISRTVADTVLQQIGRIDLTEIINKRVDETMKTVKQSIFPGIVDQSTQVQLTVLDETTVFENKLTTRNLDVVDTMQVSNLVVTGVINTDNRSWKELASAISDQTIEKISKEWNDELVALVAEKIKLNGIDFDQVTLGGQPLVTDGQLGVNITKSNLQSLGELNTLHVRGLAELNNTAYVVNKRLGINTREPEMALSVWDEEVAILVGKHKDRTAYLGTKGAHGVTIGVNRVGQIDIDAEGLTTIKKLRVGSHKISHSNDVPGWSGTKGDIVFNSNPGADRVFAWVCLGSFRWQVLKAAE